MASRIIAVDEPLYDYLTSVSVREPAVLQALRRETAALENSVMQISADQGQFMALLVRLIGARKTLEVGTFTGYSSLAVALALPEDGRVVCCDVSPDFTRVARRFWARAGVAHKISLGLGPAVESLQRLIDSGHAGTFDFAFIDADKSNYSNYVNLCHELVRPGGLIAVDNVLWSGRVIDPAEQDKDTLAIRALNEALHHDERFDLSLVPIGDGLTLLRKRGSSPAG